MEEIAYYDMSDVEGLYVGNWGTYIDLPSGNIVSSDIENGLFILAYDFAPSELDYSPDYFQFYLDFP